MFAKLVIRFYELHVVAMRFLQLLLAFVAVPLSAVAQGMVFDSPGM